MAWKIKTNYGRWLGISEDDHGFFTTREENARPFDTQPEADKVREEAKRMYPSVDFEAVEAAEA